MLCLAEVDPVSVACKPTQCVSQTPRGNASVEIILCKQGLPGAVARLVPVMAICAHYSRGDNELAGIAQFCNFAPFGLTGLKQPYCIWRSLAGDAAMYSLNMVVLWQQCSTDS